MNNDSTHPSSRSIEPVLASAPSDQPLRRRPTTVPSTEECATARLIGSDLDHQLRHAHCCRSSREREMLMIAHEKIKAPVGSTYTDFWGKQAAWNSYGSTASIIACSVYSKAEDFIRCGYSTFSCHDRLFCPRCCFNYLARPVLDEFGDVFCADKALYYIVVSLSSNPDEKQRLIFKDLGEDQIQHLKLRTTEEDLAQDFGIEFHTGDDLRDCRILWNLYTEAIREFTGNKGGGLFSGSVGGPELAVRFQPLRVLPHANYICWSPGLSADGIRGLRRFIREKMRNCRQLQTSLFPAIACYRIRSGEDLGRIIKYIFKPIDLASAYLVAADRVGQEPQAMDHLNSETNDFLKNVLDVFWQLRRASRYGRCSANHRDYFGKVTPYRQSQRDRAAERRAGAVGSQPGKKSSTHCITRWELHHLDKLERPSGPRRSQFSYWQQHNEQTPAWPPRGNRHQ